MFVGLLLAFLSRPVIRWTDQQWGWPAWVSVTFLLVIFIVIIASLVMYLFPLLFDQIAQFMQHLPDYIESLLESITGDPVKLDEEIRARLSDSSEEPKDLVSLVLRGMVKSFDILIHAFGVAAYAMIYGVLLVVFFVSFSVYTAQLRHWVRRFLPATHRARILEITEKIYIASTTYFRVRLLIAVILCAFFSIGWAVAGVPYWLLLGSLTGLLNIIPYASGLGWLITLLVHGLEAGNPSDLLNALIWPTVVFAIGQALDGWVLTPLLEGHVLRIHPVVVLFSILAGGLIAGLLGMLLAIPLTAACQIIFREVIEPKMLTWARTH
jgi:predicted PurR-regulated permease PerM